MAPVQTGTKLEEGVDILSLKERKNGQRIKKVKLNFKSPVRGEKARGDITFAKEHKPEMHP